MSEYKYVLYSVNERVAQIKLNRSDKRNALNEEMVSELKQCFALAFADEDVKVIKLTAAGEVFCAGADLAYLQQLQKNTYQENLEDSRHLMELFKMIYEGPKMVIAVVQGAAIAGGCGLASVCDIVFSDDQAKFGYTEVKIGFAPAIVSVYLMRKIGESNAKRLLLTGELITASTAQHMQLIHYICEAEELEQKAQQYCEKIIRSCSADSIALTKQMIATLQDLPYQEGFNKAAEINAKARETEDCKKGIAAFLNKEKLTW